MTGIGQQGCRARVAPPEDAALRTGRQYLWEVQPCKSGLRFFPNFLNFLLLLFFSFIILASIIIFSSVVAHSAQVTLAWDPNTEQNLAGYKLYYGFESGNYVYSIDVGNQPSYSISDLEPNRLHYFAATAYDNNGNESDFSEEITYLTPSGNMPPVANAGPDQTVTEGYTITLSGLNSSDPDDGIASYLWEQTGGPAVNISNPTDTQPTFVAPDASSQDVSLTFQLTVEDIGGLKSTDTCVVNVSWTNTSPIADAGPDQTVTEGYTITLSGLNSSDPDDGIASYLWEQTGGPVVNISNPTDIQPTFVAPDASSQDVSLTFQLTVEDFGGLRSTDTCVVNVSWTNTPPVADAGPDQTVDEGVTVTLDGSNSSDPDDGIAFVRWKQLTGIPVGFSNPSALKPTFVFPGGVAEGESLTFQLTVTDIGGLASQDTCTVMMGGNIVYEDAEDGNTHGWSTYDNNSKKGKIRNVFDSVRQSRVIKLKGTGTYDGHVLRNEDGTPWHNSKQSTIQWSMQYREHFVVYLDVETTAGHRYIYYTPDDYDDLGSGEYVHHGLGSLARDGQWRIFTRDLQSDLEEAQPGVSILEVNAFALRGNGKVDDIQLLSR